jgi:hypothetical protein
MFRLRMRQAGIVLGYVGLETESDHGDDQGREPARGASGFVIVEGRLSNSLSSVRQSLQAYPLPTPGPSLGRPGTGKGRNRR